VPYQRQYHLAYTCNLESIPTVDPHDLLRFVVHYADSSLRISLSALLNREESHSAAHQVDRRSNRNHYLQFSVTMTLDLLVIPYRMRLDIREVVVVLKIMIIPLS